MTLYVFHFIIGPMAKVKFVNVQCLIDLFGEEVVVDLEGPVVLREFLEILAGRNQKAREWLFSGNRLNPDIFILKDDISISLRNGIDRELINDSDVITIHQIAAGG